MESTAQDFQAEKKSYEIDFNTNSDFMSFHRWLFRLSVYGKR